MSKIIKIFVVSLSDDESICSIVTSFDSNNFINQSPAMLSKREARTALVPGSFGSRVRFQSQLNILQIGAFILVVVEKGDSSHTAAAEHNKREKPKCTEPGLSFQQRNRLLHKHPVGPLEPRERPRARVRIRDNEHSERARTRFRFWSLFLLLRRRNSKSGSWTRK